MSIEFLDPTHEGNSAEFKLAERLTSLDGATVAIVSNGKHGTRPFFVRIVKSNYSAPVEPEFLREAEKWQALISGVGD